MAEKTVIPAKVRNQSGTRVARRLRAEGQIPAVLYGHQRDTVTLSVDGEAVETLLRHGAYGLLELDVGGKRESAVIKEMQWDVFGREVLHVDFARTSADERVTLSVPVTLKGVAPGVTDGGVMDHVQHEVEIECPASKIIQSVTVNINNLGLDQSLAVKDLEVPEEVTILDDPEQVVVQVTTPAVEEPEEEAAEGLAEPELIRREEEEEQQEG